jgi:hypothetical protein
MGSQRILVDGEVDRIHRALVDKGPKAFLRALNINKWKGTNEKVRIPCPVHNGDDFNCSVSVSENRIVFCCFSACGGEGGDALDLVAAVRGYHDFIDKAEAAAAIAGISLRYKEGQKKGARKTRRRVTRRPKQSTTKPPEIAAAPNYPPVAEVRALWGHCLPVSADGAVADWLTGIPLDVAAIEDGDLARALPAERLPDWARCGNRNWYEAGYRVVVPLYDEHGQMRTVRGRGLASGGPKSLPAKGYATSGLVMADALARQLLKTGDKPDWWPTNEPLQVVIAEGEKDWLTDCVHFAPPGSVNASMPAVFGVISGSWSMQLARRIPNGTQITIRTDHDRAGDKYAAEINKTLARRCAVLRSKDA